MRPVSFPSRLAAAFFGFLVLLTPLSLAAQETDAPSPADQVAQMIADVAEAQEAYELLRGNLAARLTREFEMRDYTLATEFAAAWANGMNTNLLDAVGLYLNNANTLRAWHAAIRRGEVDGAAALSVLDPAMAMFYRVDLYLEDGFEAYVAAVVEGGRYTHLKRETGCCSGLYSYYDRLEHLPVERAVLPDWRWIGGLRVIPPLEPADRESGGAARARVEAMTSDMPTPLRVTTARQLQFDLSRAGVPEHAEVQLLLGLGADRLEAQRIDIEPLIEAIEGSEDAAERAELLRELQDALLERAGQLAPEAMGATLHEGADAEALSDLLATTQDLLDRAGQTGLVPSLPALQRVLGGLNLAAELAEARGEAPTAAELRGMIDTFGSTVAPGATVTAPFAAQYGAVTGQLGQTREAWQAAAEAMDGVVRMIEGDQSAMADVTAASERIQRALDPKAIIRAMAGEALDAVEGLIPGASGWISRAFSGLFS